MWQFLLDELIFEILGHFLPGLSLPITDPHLYPWYLGQICSSWRSVFISSPQFWSRLEIDTDEAETLPNLDKVFEILQEVLKRSKGHPLSLFITMDWFIEREQTDDIMRMRCRDILETLVSHSLRWRDISIELAQFLYPTLYGAKGRVPILRSIKDRQFHIMSPNSFQDTFTDATRLTRVYSQATVFWTINWLPVTVIHFMKVRFLGDIVPILQETCALEEFVVASIYDINVGSVPPVHLPSLKRLSFPNLVPISLFRTPKLEELYLGDEHHKLGINAEVVETTISNYFSTVRNLRKLSIRISEERSEFPVFKNVPRNIRDLKLHGFNISGQLRLAADCPELHNLRTISIETWSPQIPILLEMAESWAQERQGITEGGLGHFKNLGQFSLHLEEEYPVILEPMKRLKNLVEERGIKLASGIMTELQLHESRVFLFETV